MTPLLLLYSVLCIQDKRSCSYFDELKLSSDLVTIAGRVSFNLHIQVKAFSILQGVAYANGTFSKDLRHLHRLHSVCKSLSNRRIGDDTLGWLQGKPDCLCS